MVSQSTLCLLQGLPEVLVCGLQLWVTTLLKVSKRDGHLFVGRNSSVLNKPALGRVPVSAWNVEDGASLQMAEGEDSPL